jgi:hypothetical protein
VHMCLIPVGGKTRPQGQNWAGAPVLVCTAPDYVCVHDFGVA